ncbi:OsmC family protein [Candidatus Methanomassiliicoccus intestinalis]|jgi:osmC family protein|uniref:OsmC family protein n=2 Tax=Candidatus Methanomassiliicoccus intestinalis TaxID=1406512 RepID=R9T5G8_METII|nr:OsmC family protein [Candidatus Methanomassiliicoccus intestinalis]AGN26172.1 OsmC family protein [Candidatus Methanomassiliicoccus intestinalis Issoire-Mx1]TQS84748.1 MAG: hypothetical protein A3207_01570 [Candidatus Methanomassiliicoccus intestinalis]
MNSEKGPVVISREEGYRFRISFSSNKIEDIHMDEPEPLGTGNFPNAGKLLAAAVGNCLCASLTFCLEKSRLDCSNICAEVMTHAERNDDNKIRITGIDVHIVHGIDDCPKLRHCLDVFEDYCTVSRSVAEGIKVSVITSKD